MTSTDETVFFWITWSVATLIVGSTFLRVFL